MQSLLLETTLHQKDGRQFLIAEALKGEIEGWTYTLTFDDVTPSFSSCSPKTVEYNFSPAF